MMRRLLKKTTIRSIKALYGLYAFIRTHHNLTTIAYIAIFVGLALKFASGPFAYVFTLLSPGAGSQQHIAEALERVGHVVTYVIAGAGMVLLTLLYLLRRYFDPIPRDPQPHDTSALDASVELVTPDTVGDVVELGEEAFAAWGGSREERTAVYRTFSDANRDSFRFIKLAGHDGFVGFSCVLPLTEDAFCRLRLGTTDSWELVQSDLLPRDRLPVEHLCINAIYVQRAHRAQVRAVKVVCAHLAHFLRPTAAQPRPTPPFLIAEGLSVEGRRFLKRYGFESFYASKDHNPMFQLDLSRPKMLNHYASLFRSCLESALANS